MCQFGRIHAPFKKFFLKILSMLSFLCRLRRRIESYRRRQNDCMPRFDQSFTGLCEQNLQDTLQLKQRYLDAKAKRVPKSKDKKQQDSIQSSVHVVSWFTLLRRFVPLLLRFRKDSLSPRHVGIRFTSLFLKNKIV